MVLLLGERNAGIPCVFPACFSHYDCATYTEDGTLTPTALSRVERALQLLQGAGTGAVLAAGSGFGSHFNASSTPHFELLHTALLQSGMPAEAWIGGWPSVHTCKL